MSATTFTSPAQAEGETVVDFGSGSGMDTFVAALKVGASGKVIGVDMTDAQRKKAESLRDRDGFKNVTYVKGYIEEVPLPAESADVIISNGVFNLSPDKPKVFKEAARLLRPGGRLAIADIVTDVKLPETITCNTTLWAACIGGAAQRDDYRSMIEAAGLRVVTIEENPVLPIHFRQRARRDEEIRRQERLGVGGEAARRLRLASKRPLPLPADGPGLRSRLLDKAFRLRWSPRLN